MINFSETIKQYKAVFWSLFIKNSFAHNISSTFITRVSVIFIGTVVSIVTSRYLGPAGKGILATLTAIIALAVQFGNFGMQSANTYFISSKKSNLASIISNSVWISMIGGTLISLSIVIYLFINKHLLQDIPALLIMLTLICVPFNLFYLFGQNILIGIKKINLYNIIELLNTGLSAILIIVSLIILHYQIKSIIVVIAMTAILIDCILILKLTKISKTLLTFNYQLFKVMFSYGLKIYLASLFAFLMLRIDIFMVKYYLGIEEVGFYSIAVNMADLLYMLPVTIASLLFPKIAEMKTIIQKYQIAAKTAILTGIIMAPFLLIAPLFSKYIINIMYGSNFSAAVPAFAWLMPGIFFLSLATIIGIVFAASGMPWFSLAPYLFAAILNIVLNLFLISKYNIAGASISSTISYLFLLICNYIGIRIMIKKARIE